MKLQALQPALRFGLADRRAYIVVNTPSFDAQGLINKTLEKPLTIRERFAIKSSEIQQGIEQFKQFLIQHKISPEAVEPPANPWIGQVAGMFGIQVSTEGFAALERLVEQEQPAWLSKLLPPSEPFNLVAHDAPQEAAV